MLKRLLPLTVLAAALTMTVARAQDTEWKEYKSAEGRFSVLVPGTFKVDPQKLNDPNEPPVLYLHTLQARPHSFMVTWGDYPAGLLDKVGREKVQDNIRDSFLQSLKAKARSEEKAKLGDNVGRELVADFGEGLAVRYRCFLVKDRVYHFAVVCAAADLGEPQVNRFLDSFKLTEPK